MRRSLLVVLAAAVLLLLVGVSTGVAGRERTITRERNDLAQDAAEQADRLNAYFARASSIVLLTANNVAFRQFYAQRGDRDARVRRGGPIVDAANDSLGYLAQLYADRVGEACFIDASGAENARTVRGERASYADLSTDESRNPFFAPTFALGANQVYQAKPYVSPDTHDWVISNSTPVVLAGGAKPAIVHFEVALDSFRREARAHSDRTMLVIDADTGQVVLNSRHPQQVGAPLGDPAETRFHGLVGRWADAGRLQLGGHQAAYQRIAATPGNVNHWYVVSVADYTTGPLTGVGVVTILLVVATMVLIGVLLVALRRGQRTLVSAANTDALTGLFNRRRLIADLEAEIGRATSADPLLLILCDLNGFKAYNDTFGHPAGDALLARLGAGLAEAMAGRGRAYRIGGDEFCVLARPGHEAVERFVQSARDALAEHGDGFAITASHGAVLLPADAGSATEAMRAVDVRMYGNKNGGRVPADTQTINALLRAIQERDPRWAERLAATADLVREVCRHLDVPPFEQTRIVQAAQLHDVGKVAVPDAILRKRGPLSPAEWAYLRQAPAIGERITASAPALASVAALVRSAREHYDGTGYPRGLSGADIPRGARIIAACSALVAMTSDRPHARRRDVDEALAELDRGSGTRFEPRVVAAIRRLVSLRISAGSPVGFLHRERTGGEVHAASGEVRQGDRRDPGPG